MFLACEILSAAAEQSRRAGERAARILPLTSTRVFSIIIMYIYVQAVQSIRKADGREKHAGSKKKIQRQIESAADRYISFLHTVHDGRPSGLWRKDM